MSESTASPAWFRKHFNEDYLVLYSGRSREEAEREVDFVARTLGLGPRDRVLDLCCGFGRHLQAFRRRGIPVVGVDLSCELLGVARAALESEGANGRRGAGNPALAGRGVGDPPACELVCADMRELPFPDAAEGSGFSALVNFFTSFGYFDTDEDNLRALREMARVLRPGGGFAIDLLNPVPTLRSLVPHSERSVGAIAIEETRSFDARRSRIEKRIRLRNRTTGEEREYFESVRTYAADEICALLERSGLEPTHRWGDFNGVELGPDTPRMIITGRRRRER